MGFRINTNVAALSAHANALSNNRAIDSSLGRLNSGFRINSAADDASGMAIADSLRSQASSLGKAIMNANDAIGIVQTADKAMDEQIKILDTIKEKAIQSAQDGQTTETRKALQADISRLMEELDNIGNTTSFNGQKLLSGTFSNKEFQIGAYSNETVKASIGATTSDKIGLTRFETGHNVRASDLTSVANFTFKNVDGINDVTFEPVQLADDSGNIKAGMGLGALMEAINKASDKTGVKASVTVQSVFEQPIKAGSTTAGFSINGVMIGAIDVKEKDGNGALRSAINSVKDQTGVEASVDSKGRLVLANRDGRGIKVEDNASVNKPANDMHSLVVNGGGDDRFKKGVDLNKASTWTTPAGQTGSILNSSNSFADVKMAHGVQDALIQQNGTEQAKSLTKIPAIYKTFETSKNEALDKLKSDLVNTIKTEILDKTALAGQDTQKATLDAHASILSKSIEKAADLKEISDLLTEFTVTNAATNNFADTTVAGIVDAFQTATAKDVAKYADSMKSATTVADKAMKDQGVDITEGSGKKLFTELGTLKAGLEDATSTTGLNSATPADAFGAIATLAGVEDTFNARTGKMGSEIDLSGLNPEKTGALNLTGAYGIFNDINVASDKALVELKTDLVNQLKTNILDKGAGAAAGDDVKKAAIDGMTKALQQNIEAAKDINEINDLLTTYITKVTPDIAAVDGTTAAALNTALSKSVSDNYVTKVKEAAVQARADMIAQNIDTTKGAGKVLNDSLTTFNTALDTAIGAMPTATDLTAFTTFATAQKTFNTANEKAADPTIKSMFDGLKEIRTQTTVDGANASIKNLNDKLDAVIRDAKGKGMDTQEAQNGMIAHAMKQFLSGVKAGLNEPNKEGLASIIGLTVDNSTNFGRLSLSSTNGRDIQVEVTDANGFVTNSTVGYDKNVAEKTVSLRETNSTIDRDTADAMGFNSEEWQAGVDADNQNGYPAGVMTLKGAQAMMNIAEAAAKALQAVRSDLGSVQNQLVATVNNISVTQVNVKAAESNIRDVDFAQESATFSKHQILAQSGVYAMSQANAVQQNVMRLLQ